MHSGDNRFGSLLFNANDVRQNVAGRFQV